MYIIDVLIPVYRPDSKLKMLLRRLYTQETRINRIILMESVVYDFSLKEYISSNNLEDPRISIIQVDKKDFDHGGTRDLGFSFSTADVIVCMTQDAIPQDNKLIGYLVAPLYEDKIATSYARQVSNGNCGEQEKITRIFNYPKVSHIQSLSNKKQLGIKTYFCSNVCAAYKKSVYNELGGFVKKTILNEDMIFAGEVIEAGYDIAYESKAMVVHSHKYTNMQQFRRNFDIGVSQAMNVKTFGDLPSSGEGIRLVKTIKKGLVDVGRKNEIFSLYITSAYKLIGFQLGKRYRILPGFFIRWATMNRGYWEN